MNSEALSAIDELEQLVYLDYIDTIKSDFWQFCIHWDADFFNERTYLKEVAEVFQEVAEGKLNTVAISLPPRAGKSYLASLFSVWMLGRNPTGSIMRNSCTTTLAHKFSYDVRGFISDPRFTTIFEDIKLSKDKSAVTGWNLEQSESVGYFCGGVGSTIIGFGCNLLSILDDPIKDVEQAFSEGVLEKTWDWFNGAMRSRKEKGCPEIHIATRWSRRDVIGRLEAAGELDKVVKIKALDDRGYSFCESVTTAEFLKTQRRLLPTAVWEAEYQQEPIEAKGLLYPRDELNYFNGKINSKGNMVAVVDVADTGSDYLCAIVASIVDNAIYVDDVIYTQEPVEITTPLLANRLKTKNVSLCRIESNSGGRIFANNVIEMLQTIDATTTIETRATTKNKETRMLLRSGFVKNSMYFRKDGSEEYQRYLNDLTTTYRAVSKNKHDDAADATTMVVELYDDLTKHNW